MPLDRGVSRMEWWAPAIEINPNHPLAELVDCATTGHEIITLTAEGQKKAVLLSLEAFEYLIGMQQYRQRELMPDDEFHAQFCQV